MPSLARLLVRTYAKWGEDDGWLYAGAMAAFAALALAPLLLISLAVAERIAGATSAMHGLARLIDPFVGHGAVHALEGVLRTDRRAPNGVLTGLLAVAVAIFSGARLFYALQRALHTMWRTPNKGHTGLLSTVVAFVAAALLSIFFIGAFTAVIFGSAEFAAAAHGAGVRGPAVTVGVRAAVAVVGSLVLAPAVAALFRWLPGTTLSWGDVWIGAATTSAGFAVGQFVIGTYLASVNLPWTYGSTASVIVVLLWLYYSAYLFLFGAEFTAVYAHEAGSLSARSTTA